MDLSPTGFGVAATIACSEHQTEPASSRRAGITIPRESRNSSYLITGLLLPQAGRPRTFLIRFYARRARRILPAAALTLVTTDIAAHWFLNFVRAKEVFSDAIAASLFTANIHFAERATNYFARVQPPSPLQHFWTLAVEEQFYLVWPAAVLFLTAGLTVAHRSRRRKPIITGAATRRLVVVIISVGAVSLSWSIYDTAQHPISAYFSTPARAWELALGAALAIGAAPLMRQASVRWRGPAGWLGLIGIVTASVGFSSGTPFPGYAALLPTVSTALVIAAGIAEENSKWCANHVLSAKPLCYVGDRSFAFYLWHWPVLTIAAEHAGHKLSVGLNVLWLMVAFLVTLVSYRLVENPIRKLGRERPASFLVLWPLSVLAAIVLASQLGTSTAERPSDGGAQQANLAISSRVTAAAGAGRPLPAVVAAADAALRGAPIPSGLSPPLGRLLADLNELSASCAPQQDQTSSNVCRLGDTASKRSIVVMGDSYAEAWMPAILRLAQKDHWLVRPLTKSGCSPPTWGFLDPQLRGTALCEAWYKWALRRLGTLRPDVTLIVAYWGGFAVGPGATRQDIGSLVGSAKASSRRVVIMGDSPGEQTARQPVDCLLSEHATMARCNTVPSNALFEIDDDLSAAAKAAGAGFIDPRGWFCFKGQCPMVIGRTIAYVDGSHVTTTYARELAEPFRVAFEQAVTGG
ncbi:MAG: acyltransferase family protein, partial [Solirubrobacteraceae bacterium]